MSTKSKLQVFIDQAKDWSDGPNQAKESGGNNKFAKGSSLAKIFSLYGASPGTAWCAIFVYACAKVAKVVSGKSKLIGRNAYAAGICHTVIKNGGTWIPGPNKHSPAGYRGKKVKPQPGDLILFVDSGHYVHYNENGKVTKWSGKHVGIVRKVSSTMVYTCEGNAGTKAKSALQCSYSLSNKSIGGYARPDWAKAGVMTTDDATYGGPLYDTENDRHDMTMREIGYMSTKTGKLTKDETPVQIALINYTTVLGGLYDMFARNTYGGNLVDTSKLSGNEKIAVDYFIKYGISGGGACGIAANIKTDSNYNPATQSGSAYGICKWTGTKAGQMRSSIGALNWVTNLSGQLDFLIGDLEENYADLLKSIRNADVSAAGAKKAAEQFSKTYRGIKDTKTRANAAEAIFKKIMITPAKQVGTPNSPQAQNKNCTVINLTKEKQPKYLSVCTRKFEVGLCDTAMLNEWKSKGSSTSKGLAYMDGCYLVAYNTKFNIKNESYLELETDKSGTIKCIVAGAFNDNEAFIRFYKDGKTKLDLKAWKSTKIKYIKDFGKRTK